MKNFSKLFLALFLSLFVFACNSNFNEKTAIEFKLPYLDYVEGSDGIVTDAKVELEFEISCISETGKVLTKTGKSGDHIIFDNLAEGKYKIKAEIFSDEQFDYKFYGETEVEVVAGKITPVTLNITKELIEKEPEIPEEFTKENLNFKVQQENGENNQLCLKITWNVPENYKEIKLVFDMKFDSDYRTISEEVITPDSEFSDGEYLFSQIKPGNTYRVSIFVKFDDAEETLFTDSYEIKVEEYKNEDSGQGTGNTDTEIKEPETNFTEKMFNLNLDYIMNGSIPEIEANFNAPENFTKIVLESEEKTATGGYSLTGENYTITAYSPDKNKCTFRSVEAGKTYKITAKIYLNDEETVNLSVYQEIILTVVTESFTKDDLHFAVQKDSIDGVPLIKTTWNNPELFNSIAVSIKSKDGSLINGKQEEKYVYTVYQHIEECIFRAVVAGHTYIITIEVMMDSEEKVDISDSVEITIEAAAGGNDNPGSGESSGEEDSSNNSYIVTDTDLTSVFSQKKFGSANSLVLSNDSMELTGTCTIGAEIVSISANKSVTISRGGSSSSYPMFNASNSVKIGSTDNLIKLDGATLQAVSGNNGNPAIDVSKSDITVELGPNLVICNNDNYSSKTGAVYASLGNIILNGVTTYDNNNNKGGAAEDVLPDITVSGKAKLTLGNNLDIDGVYVDNESSAMVLPNIKLTSDFGIASNAKKSIIRIVLAGFTEGLNIIDVSGGNKIPAYQLALLEVYDKAGNKYYLSEDGVVSETATRKEFSVDDSNYTVSNFDELKSVIGFVNADNYTAYSQQKTVVVTQDIEFSENLTVYGNYRITAQNDSVFKRGSDFTDSMFMVKVCGKLELGDATSKTLTLDGSSSVSVAKPLIITNGFLSLNENCVLTKNNNTASSGTNLGGAVLVKSYNDTALGGAVSAELIVNGANLIENTAVKGGGAIYTSGLNGYVAKVTVKSGLLSKNTATQNGGAIYAANYSEITVEGNAKITENESILSSVNSSSTGGGGGIYVTGSSSNLNITDGEIKNNKANCKGGGIYLNNSNCTISGGIIAGNATYYGKTTFDGETPDTAADDNGLNIYGIVSINGTDTSKAPYNDDINLN